MIHLQNVHARYPTAHRGLAGALNSISFTVAKGEFRWLTGASGAGKSTLLAVLGLSLRPTSGQMDILGVEPARAKRSQLTRLRRRIGTIHQDYRLLEQLTALENVALPLRLAGADPRLIARESCDILAWLGLAGRENAYPGQLSGGECQRVAIARALVVRPDILLADEPTNALEETESRRLLGLFQEICGHGTTVIVATHNETLLRDFPAPSIEIAQGRVAGGTAPLP